MAIGQQVNVRLDADAVARLDALLARLQALHGPSVRVTRASVILEALTALEDYYEHSDRHEQKARTPNLIRV